MPPREPPPEQIGPYKIVEQIGVGGMGEVYKAYDERLDREVALKNIRSQHASVGARHRFQREAKAVARLNHPSIVRVYDWVETDESDWLVMELIVGRSLKRVIAESPLEPRRAAEVARHIFAGLYVAHSSGIVHRDLKADNVMLVDGENTVKILDFGVAKWMRQDENDMTLTSAGSILGTLTAMSPEQALGEDIDHRSDLFSGGILLYEMLTGVSPFRSDNRMQTLTRICTLKHTPVIELHAGIPEPLSDLVDYLLRKDPEERPQSAAEVIAALKDLEPVFDGKPGAIPPKPKEPPADQPTDGIRIPIGADEDESDEFYEVDGEDGDFEDESGNLTEDTAAGLAALQQIASQGDATIVASPDDTDSGRFTQASLRSGISIRGRLRRPKAGGPKATVTFREPGGELPIEVDNPRRSILDLAKSNEIEMFYECGGRARCSTCRVRILEGLENVKPRMAQEQKLAKRLSWEEDIRLGCQTRVTGDVTIERLVRDVHDIGLLFGEQNQSMPAQEIPIALFSCELLDFEHFAGSAPAYDQIHLMHRFLTQMGALVGTYGGQIQRYTGAGFLAFFGLDGGSAEEKCIAAVKAALRISDRMVVFNRYLSTYFGQEMHLGIGLHFARVVVGQFVNAGQSHLLAVGDAGSLADSVARHNGVTGTLILASEDLANVVEGELEVGNILTNEQVGVHQATLYEVYDLIHPDPIFVVQTTFERLTAWGEEAGRLFYEKLFETAPEAEAFFADTNMELQEKKFINLLTTIISGLDHLDGVKTQLRELGEDHDRWGVQPEHYDIVGEVLVETIEEIAGVELDFEVREAWEWFYDQLVAIMIEPEDPTAMAI